MSYRDCWILAIVVFNVSLLTGCGSSAATVSGTVTVDGQPLAKGQIQFTPTGSGSPAGAPIVAGKFSANLQPGEMTALVSEELDIPAVTSTEELQRQAASGQPPPPPPKSRIAPTTKGNSRVVTIKPGSQTLELELTP